MTELTRADFADGNWDEITEAIQPVAAAIEDIAHHLMVDGTWYPFGEHGDVPSLVSQARYLLDQLEKPIKEARREIARVERTAQLRAVRREKAGA